MFDFFKRKRKINPASIMLPFKSAEAAFEFCCEYMDCNLVANVSLPALVLDATKEFGTAVPLKKNDNGIQNTCLLIPSDDGGFWTMAETASAHGPQLVPGQLVAWRAMLYSNDLAQQIAETGGDKRFGWIGIIFATLKPTYHKGCWEIDQKFIT
jgi:hypothetical protein